MHASLVLAERMRCDVPVKVVRLGETGREYLVEALVERLCLGSAAEAQADDFGAVSGHFQTIVRGSLSPCAGWIYGAVVARDKVRVESVLHIGRWIRLTPQPGGVGFILREQERRGAVALQCVYAERSMHGPDRCVRGGVQ